MSFCLLFYSYLQLFLGFFCERNLSLRLIALEMLPLLCVIEIVVIEDVCVCDSVVCVKFIRLKLLKEDVLCLLNMFLAVLLGECMIRNIKHEVCFL